MVASLLNQLSELVQEASLIWRLPPWQRPCPSNHAWPQRSCACAAAHGLRPAAMPIASSFSDWRCLLARERKQRGQLPLNLGSLHLIFCVKSVQLLWNTWSTILWRCSKDAKISINGKLRILSWQSLGHGKMKASIFPVTIAEHQDLQKHGLTCPCATNARSGTWQGKTLEPKGKSRDLFKKSCFSNEQTSRQTKAMF